MKEAFNAQSFDGKPLNFNVGLTLRFGQKEDDLAVGLNIGYSVKHSDSFGPYRVSDQGELFENNDEGEAEQETETEAENEE